MERPMWTRERVLGYRKNCRLEREPLHAGAVGFSTQQRSAEPDASLEAEQCRDRGMEVQPVVAVAPGAVPGGVPGGDGFVAGRAPVVRSCATRPRTSNQNGAPSETAI